METANLPAVGPDCFSDCFADLIKREVMKNLRRAEQERKQYLVLKKYIPTFNEEIRCMMYTNGDVMEPLDESVMLVGTILRDQMNMLLIQATEVLNSRKKKLSYENLLLLLIPNKGKLKRLLHYLKLRDMKDYFYKNKPLKDDEEEKEADKLCVSASSSNMLTKLVERPEYGRRVRTCLEFIRKEDKNFNYVSFMDNSSEDPIARRRLKRRYLVTYNMNDTEYLEYARKLQASFYPKGGAKLFIKWLLSDNVTHLEPDETALEIINFLAYETVAEIIDTSLQMKFKRNTATVKHKDSSNESTSHFQIRINKQTSSRKQTFQENRNSNSFSSDTIDETEQSTNKLKQARSSKKMCNILNNQQRRLHTRNEEHIESLEESVIPNNFHSDINIYDIKSLKEDFGEEFKEGVVKEPLTPNNIRDAMNHLSGISEHKYDMRWENSQRYTLLCTQDIHLTSL